MLFWFSGFVALAVFLSGRICFGMVCSIRVFLLSPCLFIPLLLLAYADVPEGKVGCGANAIVGQVCDVARASTAISALSWLAWAVTFVFGAVGVIKGRSVGGDMGMGFGRKMKESKKVDMHQGV
jgi:hypothetical protein